MKLNRYILLGTAASVLAMPCVAFAGKKVAPAPAPTATATVTVTPPPPPPPPPPAATAPVAVTDVTATSAKGINPVYRNIQTFKSDIAPLYRNIQTFWNGVDPQYRNINTFWGTLNPVYRNIQTFGAVLPEYRNIQTFWETNGSLWADSMDIWANIDQQASATESLKLQANLNTLISNSQSFWGPSVTGRLGGTFQSSFMAPLLAKYGITQLDAQGLSALTTKQRAAFFIDWFDGLNNFTGFDQTDHWMQQTNWSPLLSETQMGGKGVTVGLVDTKLMNDADIASRVIWSDGSTAYSNNHGSVVASLIGAAHDGRGVMGVAPEVLFATNNPFDADASAQWKNVMEGIKSTVAKGASVVNLSLGEPGKTFDAKWQWVFNHAGAIGKTVFVIAAGNEGKAQTDDISWGGATGTTFLVVGSVDANNVISTFSNTPGNTCLWGWTDCNATTAWGDGGYLKNYFLVAPGENILASDGNGGVARYSGTSLAAPLVTGTVALLQSYWPWLKKYPMDTAQIVLKSAKDLGAPGVDPVYGWGLLDIQAAQSPLNFNNLTYYTVQNGVSTARSVAEVRSSSNRAAWGAAGMYVSAFETVGPTYRDFYLPISAGLSGSQVYGVYFQDFVLNRLTSWASTPSLTDEGGHLSLSDSGDQRSMPNRWGFKLSMRSRMTPLNRNVRSSVNFQMDKSVTVGDAHDRFSLTVGNGSNSFDAHQAGFGLESDYAALDGGVNPILGFASGGSHMRAQVQITPKMHISYGTSLSRGAETYQQSPSANAAPLLPRYKASANTMQVDYTPRSWLSLSASFTNLNEANSLLGVQSGWTDDPMAPSRTQAVTLGASAASGSGFSLSASATRSSSKSASYSSALHAGASGLAASSWQIAAAKTGLISKRDHLRLSLAQPLSISSGSLDVTTLGVVNRETGELGAVTQSLAIAEKSRLVGEVNYSLSGHDETSEFSLFGRNDFKSDARNAQGVAIGARYRLNF